jgi:cell division protein FtsB
VYEALEKYQRDIEDLRRENDNLAEENMNMKIKSDRD